MEEEYEEGEYKEDNRFYGNRNSHGNGAGAYGMHMYGMRGSGRMHDKMHFGSRSRIGFGLRYFILAVTAKGKATGAEIANSIEEMSSGNWRPGPGSIYIMLKNMVEEGYLQLEESDDKKYYKITGEGKKLIDESWFPFKDMLGFGRKSNVEENISIMEDAAQSLLDKKDKISEGSIARIKKVKAILDKLVQ
jgi:DNA-binding PadR family transcriptional regulator